MLHLLVDMLERVGFLIALAFVFSRSRWMRSYMSYQGDRTYQWRFLVFFSIYAILGTYSGVVVSDYTYQPAPWIGFVSSEMAIANSRTVGVVIAGLLGGVKSGFIVGATAGLHRYSLGGYVAVACMIAPIVQGLLAGLCRDAFRKRFRRKSAVQLAFVIGLLAEMLQMGLIMLLAKPWGEAIGLVSLIGVPQVLANGIGVALYFVLYNTFEIEEDRIGTEQANKALHIADRALPLWRLEFETAMDGIARILYEETKSVGVSFDDGTGERMLEGGQSPYGFEVRIETQKQKTIGHFCLYYESQQDDNPSRRRMMRSLAGLLSQQYAFMEAERQSQLLADAEIRALQAQMNPHFLFNVLNTVKSFIRTKPEDARQLVTQLSKFLRKNMNNSSKTLVPIREELDLVTSYLSLIKARLGDRLELVTEIDDRVLDYRIPPFTVQPLVENAIEHGIKPSGRPGRIRLTVSGELRDGILLARITVEDNGAGMRIETVGEAEDHAGLALGNIRQRLSYHYGTDRPLHIESKPDEGTKISFWVR